MNWLIRLLTYFRKPINGNPNEWLERPYLLLGEMWQEFNCGSCRGIYRYRDKEFQILAVQNTKKNNHFDYVLNWFEKSCKRDKYSLAFLEIGNPKLLNKLKSLGFIGDEQKMVKNYDKRK
ncbi:hypothetical protein IH981_02150 [Patescibacteria group bacterium]|nr:hypothetical protein [Patescibacteria group bacterium]